MTLIPIGILASLPSCGKKTAENEGFLPKLSEITKEDVLSEETLEEQGAKSSLWTAVVTALKTTEFDTSSSTAFQTSLGSASVSQFVTDTTQRTAYQTDRVTAFVGSASSQWCKSAPSTFSIVNPGTVLGLSTGGFKLGGTDGKTPVALTANANVYLATYKLGTSDSAPTRYMFVTVPAATPASANGAVAPDGTNYGYPITVYAHAATGGLAYEEIAAALGDMQSNHIVVAPVFPGEPVCKTYDTGTTTCTGDNILVAANTADAGKVYEDDVVDLLGAFECAKRMATVPTYSGTTSVGTETFSAKYAKVNAALAATAKTTYEGLAASGSGGASAAGAACTSSNSAAVNTSCAGALSVYMSAGQPLSYIVGLGRGGNVVNLALARAGGLNSILGGTDATLISAVRGTATGSTPPYTGVYVPEMFSCAATIAPQSTFTAGFNKVILDAWVKKGSDIIPADKLALLNAAVPGFSGIKTKIEGYLDDATLDTDAKKADAIAAYIKKIDGVMHIPLAHGGLQNWGKYFTGRFAGETLNTSTETPNAGKTIEDAQGAFLVLHGRKDIVANVSNSQVYTGVGASVTAALLNKANAPQAAPGVNWVGLEVQPLDGVSDNNHVSDASFLAGTTVVDASSKAVSTVDTANYVGKTPAATIAQFLSATGACGVAINGQADTENNADR
jgi:hypothetical protein